MGKDVMKLINMADLPPRRRRLVLGLAIFAAAAWFGWGMGWFESDSPILVLILTEGVRVNQSSQCAQRLGEIGPKAKSAIPTLLAATKVDDWIAQTAAIALWKIDRETNVLVEVFSNRMANVDRRQRQGVFHDFARLGRDLKPADSVVERLLFDDPLTGLPNDVAAFLQKVDPERLRKVEDSLNESAPTLLPRHIAALQSTNWRTHMNAVRAIGVYGPAAADAVPALVTELRQQSQSPKNGIGDLFEVLRALSEIGPQAVAATPELAALLRRATVEPNPQHWEPWYARLICYALGSIGPGASNAIPAIEFCLTNKLAPGAHLAAAAAWSRIDPKSETAIAALREFQTNGDPGLLDFANRNPSAIDPRYFIVNNLTQTRLQVQIRARVALWRLGLERELPLPALMADAAHQGVWAIEFLGEIGPPAREALPLLERYLAEKDRLGYQAAIAILKIDPAEAKRLGLPGLLIACPDTYVSADLKMQ
jgi:hypothetical protein